jgi:hypothetical protein
VYRQIEEKWIANHLKLGPALRNKQKDDYDVNIEPINWEDTFSPGVALLQKNIGTLEVHQYRTDSNSSNTRHKHCSGATICAKPSMGISGRTMES